MSYGVASRDLEPNAASSRGDAAGLDIWALLARVWARKWFLVLFVLAGVVLAYAGVSAVTPHYTGEVRILVEGQAPDPTTPLANQNVRVADQQKIESEIQVLLSRSLADKVISQLKLETWDEFATSGGGMFGLSAPKASKRSDVIDAYFARLNVYQLGTSRVIAVDFWAEHPRSATIVANAIADLYVAGQLNAQVAVTRRASSWLDEQVEKLRAQVQTSEAAVSNFRRENGLFESNGNLLKTEELSELNTQLILAGAARSEAQARLDSARGLMNSPAGVETSSEVLDSSLIQQLRGEEVTLQRRMTELSADLLPQHPDMIAAQAELDDLRRAIGAEVGKVVRRLENEVRVATARERSLRGSISRLKKDVGKEKQRESELQSLEREAAANRGLLESFLLRASEAGARDDRSIQRPEARIISRAETPQSPSFPQKGPIIMLAFMASLTLGLLIILAFEMLSGGEGASHQSTYTPGRQRSFKGFAPAHAPTPAPAAYAHGQPVYQPASTPAQRPMPSQPMYSAPDPFAAQRHAYQPPVAPPPPVVAQAQPMPQHTPVRQGPAYQAPVTQVIAQLPSSPTLTQHDQWVLGQSAKAIIEFIGARPSHHGAQMPGRIVRVVPGQFGRKGVVSLARLLAQQSVSVVVLGCAPQAGAGFTDVMCGRARYEQVMQADAQSSARFINWGSIPIHDDPAMIDRAVGVLAQAASIVLVMDADSVVHSLGASFDRASDTSLVLMSGSLATQQPLPQTQTAGLIQVV